jgi:putative transposase
MKRISAPEQTREHLRALIEGRLGTAPSRSSLVLLAARLILEEALEGEVRDEIGRDRYERADGEAKGYRNGYRPGQMKTAEGMVKFSAPQVRDTPEPFVSTIRENLAGRTQALEDLAVELYARGLSTRDIEDAFRDESGRRLLSRAAVSEITERLWAEYEAFSKRDLSEYRIIYLYVDGIAERLRAGQPREAVMAAWGISEDGRKVLLHLMAGSKEDIETVRAFFQDMRARARRPPAGRQRRSARRHPCHRGVLPAFGASALLGAPDAQSGGKSPDRSVARIQGTCGGLLSSTVTGDCPRARQWHSRRLRRDAAVRYLLLRG